MAAASRCGFLATVFFTVPVGADEGQRVGQFEVTPDASMLAYHRSGDSRSPAGMGFSFGIATRGYWRNFGGAIAYTLVPKVCTSVGLGTGPTVHFVDISASLVTNDDRVVFDAGPSFAAVDHTYTNGEPNSSAFSSTMEDVPGHLTAGAHVGVGLRWHPEDIVVGLGLSYRGGVPVGVWDARYEGAFFLTLAIGVEVVVRRNP